MQELNHTYSTRTDAIRRAVDSHKDWIQDRLGIGLSDAVILSTDLSFCDAALPNLIGYSDRSTPITTAIRRLTERIVSVETAPSYLPLIELERERAIERWHSRSAPKHKESATYSLTWVDGPLAIHMRDLAVPVVALSVRYHEGPESTSESAQDVVVIPRSAVDVFIALLKTLRAADGKPRLRVGHDDAKILRKCSWDQLVLDPSIVSLLKNDFESFFEREEWFRKMRLPFRRGYLLHGPPGNGKSTAIRAILSSRGLTAFTIRLFDEKANDEHLEYLFERAAKQAPAVVLLEDIDRCFPRAGGSATKVSLQTLLNCLDGVASEEGIITVATANDPTALDPAILRRPGRFDRVVLFADPTPELRRQYFVRMHPAFADVNLDEAVEESAGFSFAQLREAFIMAAQADFNNDGKIELDDLLNSVWSLRSSLLFGSMKPSAGFAVPRPVKRGNHD
jgi:SpoVK/Ycf46/Vps4 family AAA+-type ATPase